MRELLGVLCPVFTRTTLGTTMPVFTAVGHVGTQQPISRFMQRGSAVAQGLSLFLLQYLEDFYGLVVFRVFIAPQVSRVFIAPQVSKPSIV
jgi:hypothetical protein